ncbi:MAG: hypothetical protein H7338_09860 [Candidatus Sericytochromatia bacterium]|nr:hypothetical protein [Candidatus Sericytochromatia bacterium]
MTEPDRAERTRGPRATESAVMPPEAASGDPPSADMAYRLERLREWRQLLFRTSDTP